MCARPSKASRRIGLMSEGVSTHFNWTPYKSLFEVRNSIDPLGIFTLYTSDTCKLAPSGSCQAFTVRGIAIARVPHRILGRTTLVRARKMATLCAAWTWPHSWPHYPRPCTSLSPNPRGEAVPRKTAPRHTGDGCSFCRPMARDSGFLLIMPSVILITGRLGPAATPLLRASVGAAARQDSGLSGRDERRP